MNLSPPLPALCLSLMTGLTCLLPAARAADAPAPADALKGLRPPAVPLVANDPYFSVWSAHDELADDATTH